MRRIGRPLVMAVLALSVGCARPGIPSGGDVPETPLRVEETTPAPLAVVPPFGGPVEIRFQRRVSERLTEGSIRDAVVVSPRTGEVRARLSGQGLEISMEGGFREPTVYRVTVLPRFQDLYQNRMAGPHDLLFAVGVELQPNLLAGIVSDRLTLEEFAGARVDAVPDGEGFTHSTVADSTGLFTFPYLPAGRYRLVAYDDRNRSREPDFVEPQDTLTVSLNQGDTLVVTELALLAPDTTAAELESVAVLDSLALRVVFDDPLDPQDPLEGVQARVVRDDGNAPEVEEVLHRHAWDALRVEPPDPVDPDPAPPPPPPTPLPSQELVLTLTRPLLPGVMYRVEMEGVRNIHGVPGGGGAAEVEGPPEPQPAPPAGDADPPLPDAPVPGDPPPDAPPGGASPAG